MRKKFNSVLALILLLSFSGPLFTLFIWTMVFRDSFIYTMDLFLVPLIIFLAVGIYYIEEHSHE